MDVVRGSLREFGMLLGTITGGMADGSDEPQPARGAPWILVQVLALGIAMAALVAVRGLLVDPPVPGTVATTAWWALPGFVLALPLAIHWFAGPPRRRTVGLVAAFAVGVGIAVWFGPVAAGPWSGLLVLTCAAAAAGAVYGVVAPVPARP